MSHSEETLQQQFTALQSPSARERDRVIEELGDALEHGQLSPETCAVIGHWLIRSLGKETDATARESILNALAKALSHGRLPPTLAWSKVADELPRLSPPLLEYGIEILGACGDPAMRPYLLAQQDHPEPAIRQAAVDALGMLKSAAPEDHCERGSRCACPGCEAEALPDGLFCPYCEDHHYHTH